MKKAVLLAAVAAGLAAGAALGVFVPRWLAPAASPPQAAASGAAKPSATPVAPVRVEVAAVKEIPFARGLSAVGSLRSDESVVLRPEVASIVGALSWMQGVARMGPSRMSLFFNLLPVLTAAIAAVVLGERLTSYHLVGGALTLAGVLLAELWRPREKPAGAVSAR